MSKERRRHALRRRGKTAGVCFSFELIDADEVSSIPGARYVASPAVPFQCNNLESRLARFGLSLEPVLHRTA